MTTSRLTVTCLLASLLVATNAVTCSKTRLAAGAAQVTAGSSGSTAPSQLTWGCQVEAADGINTYVSWTVTDVSGSATVANQIAVSPAFYYSSTGVQTTCASPYTGAAGQTCTNIASAANLAGYFQVFTMWGYPCFQGQVPNIVTPVGYVFTAGTTTAPCPNNPINGQYTRTNSYTGQSWVFNCTGAALYGTLDTNSASPTFGTYINCFSASTGLPATCNNGTWTGAGTWASKTQYTNTAFLYQSQGTPAWFDLSQTTTAAFPTLNPQSWCRSDLGSLVVGSSTSYLGAGKCSSQGWIQVPSQGTPTCIMVVCLNTGWQTPVTPSAGAVLPTTAPNCQLQLSIAIASSLADAANPSNAASLRTGLAFLAAVAASVAVLF